MKNIFSLLSFALLTATFCRGAEAAPSGSADAYTQAVTTFVEAANREMIALHAKAEADAKKANDEDKPRYEEIKRTLNECDDLLEQLTSVNRGNFDRVKSAYEREREGAIKALDKLKKE